MSSIGSTGYPSTPSDPTGSVAASKALWDAQTAAASPTPAPAASTPGPATVGGTSGSTTGLTSAASSSGVTGAGAYDPTTGLWKYGDDSVEGKLTGLLASDSPLLTQAEATGQRSAADRGLQNSTMGVQAGQAAAYSVALPIAEQDATETSQKNLSAQGTAQTGALNTQQDTAAAALQKQQSDASNVQTQEQIASQEKIAGESQATSLDVANLDNQTQQQLGQLSAQTQLAIANMNVTSDQQDKAAGAAISVAQIYGNTTAAITSNTAIPSDARDAYLASAADEQSSNLALVEKLYNVDLSTSGAPSSGDTGTGTPDSVSASQALWNEQVYGNPNGPGG